VDDPKDEKLKEEIKRPESAQTAGERAVDSQAEAAVSHPPADVKAEIAEPLSGLPPVTPGPAAGVGATPPPLESETAEAPVVAEAVSEVSQEKGGQIRSAYEHPIVVRFCHWLNAISIFVMTTTGLRIFKAFPSFGPKVPQKALIDIPGALTLGGWLGGALRWHFTFMWIFVATGILYLVYQFLSGHYKTVLFVPRDVPGVWPMARHYFLFGPKPAVTSQYNPLQKLAYTSTVFFGVASVLTGVVIYKPVQFSWLAWLMGGFHLARVWHFAAMCGFLAFIPGHLIMVALHGWNNFFSMLSGWKKDPEYGIE
jgi:Ni/Fe-hydrogenase b-type cytochrome subunit